MVESRMKLKHFLVCLIVSITIFSCKDITSPDKLLVEAHMAKAHQFYKDNKLEESLREYKEVLSIEPFTPGVTISLGIICLKLNKFDEAEKYLKLSLQENEKVANYHLGVLSSKKGNYEESLKYFLEFGKIKDKRELEINYYNHLGIIYHKLGNLAEAENFYKKALALNPDFKPARDNLSAVETSRKSLTGFIVTPVSEPKDVKEPKPLDEIKNVPEDLEKNKYYLDLSEKEFNNKNYTKALEYSQKALEYNRKDKVALNNIGYLYLDFKEYKKSEEYIKKSLEIDSNYSEAIWNIASLQLKTEEYQKAKENFTKLHNLEPGFYKKENYPVFEELIKKIDIEIAYQRYPLNMFNRYNLPTEYIGAGLKCYSDELSKLKEINYSDLLNNEMKKTFGGSIEIVLYDTTYQEYESKDLELKKSIFFSVKEKSSINSPFKTIDTNDRKINLLDAFYNLTIKLRNEKGFSCRFNNHYEEIVQIEGK